MSSPAFTQPGVTARILLKAYACGIFPMAESAQDSALYWIDPEDRGILPLDNFHIPKRLRRTVRQSRLRVTVDTAFSRVVAQCAKSRPNRPSTWINRRIERLYTELHKLGAGHSIEVWDQLVGGQPVGDQPVGEQPPEEPAQLVGGVYGISLGAAFFGESMFSTVTDASKIALVHLAARLKSGGYVLLDTQFITDHLRQFGAIEIPRADYHQRLEAALALQGDFFSLGADPLPEEILQSFSQTS